MKNTELSGMTVRGARDQFFRDNGFSLADYSAPWVRLKVGPIPLAFPNIGSRRRAVVRHDLHHIATGYGTDWRGESEMSAWEVAAGCGDYWAAWALGVVGVAIGLVIAPVRTSRAWKRGRKSRTLYHGEALDVVLDLSVEELRTRLVGAA